MSADLLVGILWIPFVSVILVTGWRYCVQGYRKGLWYALINLGAVLLSTLLSILFSRLLAAGIAPAVVSAIPLERIGDASAAIVQVLLTSGLSVAISVALFGILLPIFVSIIGAVVGIFLKKHYVPGSRKMKWFGLITGAVAALVYSLFWLSPIYGTLAAAAPVAETVMSFQKKDEGQLAQVADYVDGVNDHFLVKVSGAGPVSWVYDGVSKVSVGGTDVSVVEMSNGIKETLSLFQQLQQTDDPQQLTEISQKLVKRARKTFVDQPWFYSLSQELVGQLKEIAKDSNMSDIAYIQSLLDLLEMPQSEFRETAGALLDFAQFALSKGIMEMNEDTDPMKIYQSGVLQEMGRVFNSSDRLVRMKKLMLGMNLEEVGLTYEESMALLDRYQVGKLTRAEDQLAEAEAMILSGMGRDIPPAAMILRHPSLGEAALEDVQEKVGFAALMGFRWEEDSMGLTEKEQRALLEQVKIAAKLPFAEAVQYETGLRDTINAAESAIVDYAG